MPINPIGIAVKLSYTETFDRKSTATTAGRAIVYNLATTDVAKCSVTEHTILLSKDDAKLTTARVFGKLNQMTLPDKIAGEILKITGKSKDDARKRQDLIRSSLNFEGIAASGMMTSNASLQQLDTKRDEGTSWVGGLIPCSNPYTGIINAARDVVWDVPDPQGEDSNFKHIHRSNAIWGPDAIVPFLREYDPDIVGDHHYYVGRNMWYFNGAKSSEMSLLEKD
jgi:hypothetical protein